MSRYVMRRHRYRPYQRKAVPREEKVGLRQGILVMLSILFFLVAIASLWTWSGGDPHGEWVLVSGVVDGDTIYVGRGWRKTKVRLIGVDTPETLHPYKPVEFFGPEASLFTEKSLKGKKVHLEFEPEQLYDDYGRLLAYVFFEDGTLFNAELIKRGYARVIAVHPFKYYRKFKRYEREAKRKGLGIWSQKKEKEGPIKTYRRIVGNKRTKVYHLPGQRYYPIKEENKIYFESEEEAIRAGYRRAKR